MTACWSKCFMKYSVKRLYDGLSRLLLLLRMSFCLSVDVANLTPKLLCTDANFGFSQAVLRSKLASYGLAFQHLYRA